MKHLPSSTGLAVVIIVYISTVIAMFSLETYFTCIQLRMCGGSFSTFGGAPTGYSTMMGSTGIEFSGTPKLIFQDFL
jgi:hypothetical protein